MKANILLTLLLLTLSSAVNAEGIHLRDPLFYSLLEPATSLDCRYLSNASYGFLLERKSSDKLVDISVINNDLNEGAKTAFQAQILGDDMYGIYLRHYRRQENYASYIEFKLGTQKIAERNYKFAGKVAFTEAFYTKDAEGKEVEDLYPVFAKNLLCEKVR